MWCSPLKEILEEAIESWSWPELDLKHTNTESPNSVQTST